MFKVFRIWFAYTALLSSHAFSGLYVMTSFYSVTVCDRRVARSNVWMACTNLKRKNAIHQFPVSEFMRRSRWRPLVLETLALRNPPARPLHWSEQSRFALIYALYALMLSALCSKLVLVPSTDNYLSNDISFVYVRWGVLELWAENLPFALVFARCTRTFCAMYSKFISYWQLPF